MAVSKKNYGYSLLGIYVKSYEERYGRKPPGVNRYRDVYGFMAMEEDLGYDQAKLTILFYLEKTEKPGHPLPFLLYNYDKLWDSIQKQIAEEDRREAVREETRRRMEAFNERDD